MRLSTSSCLHHYTDTLLGKMVHFLNDVRRERFLNGVSGFFEPLKKKGRKLGFEGKFLVE